MKGLAKLPGILADTTISRGELDTYVTRGYKWIAWQVQNDLVRQDFREQIAEAGRAGLIAGAWGVTYDQQHFYRDGLALGFEATIQRAKFVMVDAEACLKNTRGTGAAQNIIDGCFYGGWRDPVHLTTLGGPFAPRITPTGGGNDYGFDYDTFLQTGGDVFLQTYFNMADEYAIQPSLLHAIACGVPRERLNAMIALTYSEDWAPKPNVRIPGKDWAPMLLDAGVTANHSIFIARAIQPGDLEALEPLAKATKEVREMIAKLNLVNTGVNAALANVEKLFDAAAIEEPDGVDALKTYLLNLGNKVNELVDQVNAIVGARAA